MEGLAECYKRDDRPLGDLSVLPKDIVMFIMIRLKDIRDILSLACTNSVLKEFLRDNDVPGKWFCLQLGFETTREANVFMTDVCQKLSYTYGECFEMFWYESTLFQRGLNVQFHIPDGAVPELIFVFLQTKREEAERYLQQVGIQMSFIELWNDNYEMEVRNLPLKDVNASDPVPVHVVGFLKVLKVMFSSVPRHWNSWTEGVDLFLFNCRRVDHLVALFKTFKINSTVRDDDDKDYDDECFADVIKKTLGNK